MAAERTVGRPGGPGRGNTCGRRPAKTLTQEMNESFFFFCFALRPRISPGNDSTACQTSRVGAQTARCCHLVLVEVFRRCRTPCTDSRRYVPATQHPVASRRVSEKRQTLPSRRLARRGERATRRGYRKVERPRLGAERKFEFVSTVRPRSLCFWLRYDVQSQRLTRDKE